jgi:ferredoxin-NADP reductase
MPSQTIKLMRSEEVAEGTMAFRFTRPSAFEFRAGQSVDVTLSIHRRRTWRATRAHSPLQARLSRII